MIDRHAVHALLETGQSTKEIAAQLGVSRRTIQRIAKEPPVEEADDVEARRRRGVGRPAVPEPVRLRLRDLIAADGEAPPLEHLRQLREQGERLGESTFYRLYQLEKEMLPAELMCASRAYPVNSRSLILVRRTCAWSTAAGSVFISQRIV